MQNILWNGQPKARGRFPFPIDAQATDAQATRSPIGNAISATRTCQLILLAASLCAGCNADEPRPAATATPSSPAAASPSTTQDDGRISLLIDGAEMTFDHVLADHTYYSRLASQITASASEDADTRLQITFLSMDLNKIDFPADLPPRRDSARPMDPMMAGATVGFSYIDAAGTEWAGPGRIHVESYDSDGVISGRFSDVSLPHTDKTLPNALLTNGQYRARISGPR